MGCDIQRTLRRIKPCDDIQARLINRTLRLLRVFQCDANLIAMLFSATTIEELSGLPDILVLAVHLV